MFEDKALQLKKSGVSEFEIASTMPQYQSLKSTMYRKKADNYPRIPVDDMDLDFWSLKRNMGRWGR